MTMDKAKLEVRDAVTKLQTMRDEIRVQIHLASLDAKKEWDETLAPKVTELEGNALAVGDGVRHAAFDLLEKLEHFSQRLRGAGTTPESTPTE